MPEVRVRCGVPVVSDFAGRKGTPIVVDEETGNIYVLLVDGSVFHANALGNDGGGGPHTHAQGDITGLGASLDGKAANDHNHDGAYAPISHGHNYAAPDHHHDAAYAGVNHGHAISAVTGLQSALDGKQAAGSYAATGHNHDSAYAPVAHNHDAAYEPKNANIQAHVVAAHAPSNAQKNSDIQKAEIEAKLTGEITTHTHPAGGGGADPWTIVSLAADVTTGSATAVDVAGLAFTPAPNTNYMFEAVLGIRTATATVNPRVGMAWPTGMADGVAQVDESQSVTARLMSNGNIGAALLVAVGGIPNTTQSWPVTVWGWARSGATPSGNIRIQLASETAGTVVRVVARSYLRYRTYP